MEVPNIYVLVNVCNTCEPSSEYQPCTYLFGLIDIGSSFNEFLYYFKMSTQTSCKQWTLTILMDEKEIKAVAYTVLPGILHQGWIHT